jgi:hypothetical protein
VARSPGGGNFTAEFTNAGELPEDFGVAFKRGGEIDAAQYEGFTPDPNSWYAVLKVENPGGTGNNGGGTTTGGGSSGGGGAPSWWCLAGALAPAATRLRRGK